MDGTRSNLKLFAGGAPFFAETHAPDTKSPALAPAPVRCPPPDTTLLANRELVRPVGSRHTGRELVPFSAAWYDELEQKRYQRHGAWLPAALEFGRHPGESLLLLGPGLGSDAIRYVLTGTPVTIGMTPEEYPDLVRENLARHALRPTMVDLAGPALPFPDATFDIVTWNALHESTPPDPARVTELFRILKGGGKVIGLFPARYDAGYWQDLLLPLQWLYWRRPADPATGAKSSGRQLRRAFVGFHAFRVSKRHLRKSELPHPLRIFPLTILERFLGRVLVFKALKPLSARTGTAVPLAV